MTYREAKQFLSKYTQVVELTNAQGARVAICPGWQGRVMTSTCGGLDGQSFGYMNTEFIEKGEPNLHFNNYGGEDRFWLAPEGGQFSLWFRPGDPQDLDHWFTPPAFNEGHWEQLPTADRAAVRMTHPMHLANTSSAIFDLKVDRAVRLLGSEELPKLFGAAAGDLLASADVKKVAYETTNCVTNSGPAFQKEKGLVSIWILGMLAAGPQTVVMVPYRPGPEAELGPVVNSNYFGTVPPERLETTPQAILFRGDANYRASWAPRNAGRKMCWGPSTTNRACSRWSTSACPTIPPNTTTSIASGKCRRRSLFGGTWSTPTTTVLRRPGKKGLGAFFEIESLSPALSLTTGQTLVHQHRTLHVQAPLPLLAQLAKVVLGVDLDEVRRQMLQP